MDAISKEESSSSSTEQENKKSSQEQLLQESLESITDETENELEDDDVADEKTKITTDPVTIKKEKNKAFISIKNNKRRRKTPIKSLSTPSIAQGTYGRQVKNATAAEILLKKLQNAQGRPKTYHDPEFKNKKLVRVRPRAKSLAELTSQASTSSDGEEFGDKPTAQPTTLFPKTESSPILTSNALLLNEQAHHHKIAPQGSHPFDWSRRHQSGRDLLRNKFRIFRNQALKTRYVDETTTTKKTVSSTEDLEPEPTSFPGRCVLTFRHCLDFKHCML